MAIKEQSQRQLRVGQEIKKIIAEEIDHEEVRNLEGIDTMVTVTEVQISPDLKYANVYFITSHNDTNVPVREALQLAASHFKKVIGRRTTLRYVPDLIFRIDNTFAEVDRIEALLRNPKVQEDLKKPKDESSD